MRFATAAPCRDRAALRRHLLEQFLQNGLLPIGWRRRRSRSCKGT